jgi:hypothetical protein
MYALYNNIRTKNKITKITKIDINTRLNNSNTKCAFHTIKLENE